MKKFIVKFIPHHESRYAFVVVKFAVEDGVGIVYYLVDGKVRKDFEVNGTIIYR